MSAPQGLNRPKTRPAQRPLWLTVLLIFVAMLVLFGIGFGIATLLKGSGGSDSTDASASPSASATVGGCTTIMVTPAEVLPLASRVTVNVYNSTKRVGLAGEAAKLLGVRGFKIANVENDPLGVVIEGKGEIRYGPKGETGAQLMAYHFPGATLINDGRSGKRIDVVLGTQFAELANDAEVVAQLAKPSPSASPEGCLIPDALPSQSASEPGSVTESPNES
jgi:hypothetical protein